MERTNHVETWKNERNNGRDSAKREWTEWLCRKFVGKDKEELITRISLSLLQWTQRQDESLWDRTYYKCKNEEKLSFFPAS
jgi:hypothetical protein